MHLEGIDDLLSTANWFLSEYDSEPFGRFYKVAYIKVCGLHDGDQPVPAKDLSILLAMTIGRLVNEMTEQYSVTYGAC